MTVTATNTPVPPIGQVIRRGTAYAHFAYDVGLSIQLDQVEALISENKQRETIRRTRRAPTYFEYQAPPLRLAQSCDRVPLGRFATAPTAEILVFDFGAVSVTFSVPLEGAFDDLRALADDLYDNTRLLESSQTLVEALARSIRPAIVKPGPSNRVEDYMIYQIESLEPAEPPAEFVGRNALAVAQILRAEQGPLSAQEIDDALSCRMSFSPSDVTIIDWNAAMLFDAEADDVRAVLEFSNVELLEMRFLDDQLDRALDRATEALGRMRGFVSTVLHGSAADLRRIAELQIDAALLYESVNNTLKLMGDPYLARVSRLASQRFHLNDWDASILRKLQTIESVYQKIADRESTRRMELLEWIIIALIAVSILLPLTGGNK
ncbi:MAG: hypothetical protein KJ057_16165 [Phycisphaerae bacterium]|nr:MAG: hypothetical protein EDS66_11160 [Planctomycetota bacterium]KAB2945567.1 MAG: hypothetical protein F9K17_09760 [Phycisphaerae bacterium]MBE7456921.1 hypothetical protein [Planctomycetia bacterium]MCK6466258.1 hypothetical protein [Phycisphaerae bacterium]MCL4720007.1 hypothetical protein [Phycisphaerae bacterium]